MKAPVGQVGLKVLSVVLAVVLWMVVSGEETVERGLRIPLELQQFPQGLELRGEAPTLVDARVRGSSDALSRMGPGDLVAVLDLHAAGPGRQLFQLTPELVRGPFGVQVVQIVPATIVLTFEKSMTREIRVMPQIEGVPAPGFHVGTIAVQPKTVEVVGPAGAVERAVGAMTSAISVAGARANVTDSVAIGFLDPALRLKNPGPANVTVEISPDAAPQPRPKP